MKVNPIIFKIFAVVATISAWAGKAMSDGKIDPDEAAELLLSICGVLGIEKIVRIVPTRDTELPE